MAVVGLGDDVACVREGGHPGVVVPLGVPPDVVRVKVRVDDDVDRFGRDARPLQRTEEVGVEVVQRRHRGPVSTVARPGVDQHRQPIGFDDPGLQRDTPGLVGPERRRELRGEFLPRLGRRLREQGKRQIVDLPFDDACQRRGAQRRPVDHNRTLRPKRRPESCWASTARFASRCRVRSPRVPRRRWCRTCAAIPSRGPSPATGRWPSRVPAAADR